ncbi:hypothetical protein SAMN05216360_103371 [Methylobacterium phyllostachyos]|uniref:MxaH protein n=1 Tax=Methylobacterium phyllostachyos TaxID=582672 RepID=A0A1G9W3S4_9HYPH|nr:MxaH protein [Methylobacterium phyllostachyos]SDM78831.1 hypothetical protein SAMN05216360_103371 [Methylobacterium phyllostachyos]
MRRRVVLPALALLMPLAACDRGEDDAKTEDTVVSRTAETELAPWLSPKDGTDPARWLAGREAGHPLANDAPPVQAMRTSLARAAEGFIEDRRMIANRTVQLGQMLAESGKAEGYRDLLDGLGRIAAARGRHKSLYGEMCQHYVNIRNRGLGHEAALAELSENEVRPLTRSAP